jgi:hypothetical protein
MKLKTIRRCLLAALLVAGAPGHKAAAAPVTVPDFSFENTAFASTNIGGVVGTSGTNWLATGDDSYHIQNFNATLFAGTDALPSPAGGTNCFVQVLNGHAGFCWQDIGRLQTNTLYTLTVAIGQTYGAGSGSGKIALVNGFSPFQTVLAETLFNSSSVTPGTFSDVSLVYTAGYQASGDLTILMQGDAGGFQIVYDNIRLDATALPQSPTAVLPVLSTPSSTVYQGTLVTLSELPAGAAPFHYQWQSDNGTTGATFTDIASANSSTCVVDTSGFTLSSPVEYRVVVTNSLGGSTSAPVALTAIQGPPLITRDTLPVTAYTIVGDEITFSVSADGSRPLAYQWLVDNGAGPTPIPNATNTTLTLSNLQLTDAGYYSLQVSNEFGVVPSTASVLSMDPVPQDESGIIISPASQLGFGGTNTYVPTWVLATNSLIAGSAPSSSVGDFSLAHAGGIPVLTDGQYGTLPPEGNASVQLATCGRIGALAGSSIIYTLPASANGYDLTKAVIYGGWSDAGRDQQQYILYYSTMANPSNFNNSIAYVNFQPTNTANAQSATRITLTGTNGVLANNVAAVKLDFNILVADTENGYTGYAEFQVFGVPSAPKPVMSVDTQPATGSDVEGSQINFVAAFSSDTPIAYQWQTDKGSGAVDIPGATNTTLTLTHLQLSDSGSYSLKASNASGTSVSRSSSFVVNPLPSPDGYGVIVSPANQTGSGKFTPTWSLPADSLIAGFGPSARGSGGGSYALESSGGLSVLTDGKYGSVGSGNTTLATCGVNAGHSVTYTLVGSQSGYDITNIVVYAGWGDRGRDQQAYTVYYSTIADPDTFIPLSSTDYNPTIPQGPPSADRVTFSSPTSLPLAANVAKVMFDFTIPAGENFYSGYAEIAVFGSASAPVSLLPVLISDTLPMIGSDVVGSEVTFTAGFNGTTPMTYQWRKDTGSGPVEIPGATSPTLTLSNLQLSDSAHYSLLASNEFGTATTTLTNTFTVLPAPTPANGMLVATANQLSIGPTFTPTWTVASSSLVAGLTPSSVGSGNFANEGGGGTVVLTDGKFGSVGGGNSTLATCGVGVGTTVTYTLAGAATGYDLSRIVTYGGWGDAGRDQQHYTVSYSTVAAPTTFVQLVSASYNPTNLAGMPSADRVTITSATTTPLATRVAAVKFDFTSPTGENGWSGYAELSVFGVKSPLPLQVSSVTVSGGNLILTGTGSTPGGSYTWLTATNVASPASTWTTNSTGVFDANGAFSNAIPVNHSEPARFFRLRTP